MKKSEKPPRALLVPVLAFFDQRAYRAVAMTWRGWAVLYSLAVTTLSWAVLLPISLPQVSNKFVEFVNDFETSFPDFAVVRGEFYSGVVQPFVITDSRGKTVLVIDEQIQGAAAPMWQGESVFFIGRHGIFYGAGGRMSRLDMGDMPDMDKAGAVQALRAIPDQVWAVAVILLPLLIAGSLFLRLVLTLLWTLFAVVIGKVWRREFGFAGAFRVVAVASTPALFFTTVGAGLGLGEWVSWVGLATTIFYILFGMLSLDKRCD